MGGANMKIKIRDLNINYKIIGEGKPLLMVHGFWVDHRLMAGCMEPVFENRTGYKRIYIDLPGMGESASNDSAKSSDAILDILIEFIETIIPDENFLVAGESYGGYLSRGIIYKLSHRVDGIMLICPAIIADNEKRTLPERTVIIKNDELLKKYPSKDMEDYLSGAVVQSENHWFKFRDNILPGIKLANANTKFLTELRQTGYSYTFDVDKLEHKFEKPSLIFIGHQDEVVGFKDALAILDNYPRATYALLDSAGHGLEVEQHVVFTCLVNEWLNRVEAYLK